MFLLFLLCSVALIRAQPSILDNISINQQEIDNILKAHNDERAKVCSADLTWSTSLARAADVVASTCETKHSGNGYGESLYASTWIGPPTSAVFSWIREKTDHNWDCKTSTCCNLETGHYTQVVSQHSTEVGCAAKRCKLKLPDGSFWPNALYVVCNYNPAGNREPLYDRNCCDASATTTIPVTTPEPTIVHGAESCNILREHCSGECGNPTIFGFDQCTTNFDQGIGYCRVPPGCTCDIPTNLRTGFKFAGRDPPTTCQESRCRGWQGLIKGSLGWCNNCAYDCGGYQTDCIADGFCKTNSKCAQLKMCDKWRLANGYGPTPEPTPVPTLSPTPVPTTASTVAETTEPTTATTSTSTSTVAETTSTVAETTSTVAETSTTVPKTTLTETSTTVPETTLTETSTYETSTSTSEDSEVPHTHDHYHTHGYHTHHTHKKENSTTSNPTPTPTPEVNEDRSLHWAEITLITLCSVFCCITFVITACLIHARWSLKHPKTPLNQIQMLDRKKLGSQKKKQKAINKKMKKLDV